MANPTGSEMVAEIEKAKPDPRSKVICLLNTVKREGMDKLILWLEATDYFTAPASIRFRGIYPGGLVDHSLEVYNKLAYLCNMLNLTTPTTEKGPKPLPVTSENIVIMGILHDTCKINAFLSKDGGGYKRNPQKPAGHAKLSIQRISEFIKLDPIEEMAILYHMGPWGTVEMDSKKGEYHILSQTPQASKEDRYGKSMRNAWYHNIIVRMLYFADEIATHAQKVADQQ